MKKLFTFLILILVSSGIWGQTTLSPGDIMLVTVNADGSDNFDFVPLVDLQAGTVIYFADNAWDGTALLTNEGTKKYTAANAVSAGTVVSFSGSNDAEWTDEDAGFNISGSGDNMLVFQGSSSSPSFLLGVGWALSTPWISSGAPTTNNSYIPSELSTGANTIVSLGTSDNYQYDVTNGTTGTKNELLALAANGANFNSDNSVVFSALSATFTVNGGVGDTPPSISNVGRDKKVPLESEDLVVTADVTDDNLLTAVNFIYTINGGSQNSSAMTNTTGDTYSKTISNSAYSDGDIVEYWISATDDNLQTTEGTHYQFFAGTTTIISTHAADGNGALLYTGAYCRVTGVATVASGVFSASNLDVFVQDATGGVNIFLYGGSGVSVTAANSYTVVGSIAQFNGKTEVVPDDAGDVTDNGVSTMPSPSPMTLATINTNPEAYEGMLVIVQHISKDATNSGTWTANGNLTMTDDAGTNTIILYLDADTDVPGNAEPSSYPIDLRGILTQYDNSSAYTSGYEIVPRTYADDIAPDGSLPVELTSFTAIANGNAVNLKWQTATEVDNYGFEIERSTVTSSTSATVWQKIAFVEGAGNSNSPKEYSYIDASVVSGKYTYRLKQVDIDGQFQYSNEVEAEIAAPAKYSLAQNYPNPFNPTTVITYQLPENGMVNLTVYDVLGNEVSNLVNETQEAGKYHVTFNASNLASGIYFYKLSAGSFTSIKKLMLLK